MFWGLGGILSIYLGLVLVVGLNQSEWLQRKLFVRVIAWESLIKDLNEVAVQVALQQQRRPVFVPLDNYPIASQLAFYQKKLVAEHEIKQRYAIMGSHIVGAESLMYRYWTKKRDLSGVPLILISKELWRFDVEDLKRLKSYPL